jgi:hypothetical protein
MYSAGVHIFASLNRIQARKGVYVTQTNTLLFGILYNGTYKKEEENFQYEVKKIKRGRAGCVETSFTAIFLLPEHCIVSVFLNSSFFALRYITSRHAMMSQACSMRWVQRFQLDVAASGS